MNKKNKAFLEKRFIDEKFDLAKVVIGSLNKVLVILDDDLDIIYIDYDSFNEVFGFERNDVIKSGFKIIFGDIFSYKEFKKFLETSAKSFFTNSVVFRNVRSNRVEIHCKYTLIPYHLNGDKINILVIEDISKIEEQKKLIMSKEKDLIHYQRLDVLGKLISGIAHDLNNPLASIYGIANILIEDETLEDDIRQDLKIVTKAAQQCKNITENLLKFVRKKNMEKEYIEIKELIESVLLFLNYHFRKNNIEKINISFQGENLTVLGYFSELQQVFYNIIINSIDELIQIPPKDRYLEIKCYSNKKNIIIEIFNTGRVIEPQIVDKIFEPFFSTKKNGGTGLGLYIAKKIIKEHDGEIMVDKQEKKGARFIISLPTTQDVITKVTTNINKKIESKIRNKNILIVDDDENFTEFLLKFFSKENKVDITKRIVEIENYNIQSYDLVICDVVLPDGNGIDLYLKYKNKTKFIFVTADILDTNLFSFFEKNNLMCIKKPFTIEELVRAILLE
ncbi:MAG: ATP-binding protein [Elusimicrobiales bacterium]|nr:ATP-binding protein [Elusimicrobiales bacterium]